MKDRTIHGITDLGDEIVRYDRAGKWYIEPGPGRVISRLPVTVKEAAWHATQPDAQAFLNKSGGNAFDRLVTQYRADQGAAR